MPNIVPVRENVRAIEAEMLRIGYWAEEAPAAIDATKLYGGVSFEQWLQFVFLPKVWAATHSGNFDEVPDYRVGLAALRQYDYHSTIEEAHPLMSLCHDLEKSLSHVLSERG